VSVRRRIWANQSGERREAWVVDYSDASGVRRNAQFERKRDADAYDAEVRAAVRRGVHTAPSGSPTVAEAAEDWLTFVEREGRERTTVKQYREHVRLHIVPRLGRERLANLTTPRIHQFRDDLLRDRSRPLAKKVLISLKAILNDAMRRGAVAQNVAKPVSIAISKREQHKLVVGVDIPTPDEIRKLLDVGGRLRPLMMVAAFAGLRSSELLGLQWADVDLRRGEIAVRQRADRYKALGKPKSVAGSRTTPIGPMVANALREWRLGCPEGDHDLVFPTAAGGVRPYTTVLKAFGVVQVKAGVTTRVGAPKYALHALRHFYASWCINRIRDGGLELPIKTVQERIGHSSIQMTADVYGHLFPSRDDGAELAEAERRLMGLRPVAGE
jgi:integrase